METVMAPATGQRHQWDLWDSQARKRLIGAHDALAARLGRPPFDAENRRNRQRTLDLEHIGELEMVATLAEAVAALATEIDALRLEVAALKGKS